MCASSSGVCCGSLAQAPQAEASARVDFPQLSLFFLRMLGPVLDRQPTVILRVNAMNAWPCTRRTTNRGRVSVIADKKEKKRERERSETNRANL